MILIRIENNYCNSLFREIDFFSKKGVFEYNSLLNLNFILSK